MPFQKGQKKLGGRAKGSVNRITQTVRETVLEVFNDLQEHETANLKSFAIKNPRDFYAIAAKLIPQDISSTVKVVDIKIDL